MVSTVTQPAWDTIIEVDGERRAVVRECELAAGHWYCVTHKLHSGNNLSAFIHEQDGREHVAVWLCDTHGPEGVPA